MLKLIQITIKRNWRLSFFKATKFGVDVADQMMKYPVKTTS